MFEAIRDHFFPLELPNGIIARSVDQETAINVRRQLFDEAFPHWNTRPHYTQPEARQANIEKLRNLMRQLHFEYFVFYNGDEPVGWSAGRMQDTLTFRMNNTGILPSYRRQGIYGAFLGQLLAYIKEVGYECVISYHHPTNRAIIGAKLKAGFNITGHVLSEEVGATIQMTYFCYPDRFRAFEQMMGLEPDFTQETDPNLCVG